MSAEADTTIEHLDGPVICRKCEKPLELEMPTAIVTSAAEVAQDAADDNRIAEGGKNGQLRKFIRSSYALVRLRPLFC